MNAAIIYEAQDKYEEALEMHTKSLDIKTRILGGNSHPSVATSYGKMDVVLETTQASVRRRSKCTRNRSKSGPACMVTHVKQ